MYLSLYITLSSSQENLRVRRLPDWSVQDRSSSIFLVKTKETGHLSCWESSYSGQKGQWKVQNTRDRETWTFLCHFSLLRGFHHVGGLGNSCADLSKIKWD